MTEQTEGQKNPVGPIDWVWQTGASFYDATYSFGRYVVSDPAAKSVFETASSITGKAFLAGSVAIGAIDDGVNGAIKGAITGYSGIVGAEAGIQVGAAVGLIYPPAELVTVPLGAAVGAILGGYGSLYLSATAYDAAVSNPDGWVVDGAGETNGSIYSTGFDLPQSQGSDFADRWSSLDPTTFNDRWDPQSQTSFDDRFNAVFDDSLSADDSSSLAGYIDQFGSLNPQDPISYLQESQQFSSLTSSEPLDFTDSLDRSLSEIGSVNQAIDNGWLGTNDTSSSTNSYTDLGNPSGDYYPQPTVTVSESGSPTDTSTDTNTNSDGSGGNGDTSDDQNYTDPNEWNTDETDDDGPVVLDLAGNGINIAELKSSNTFKDMTGDGYKNRTAWAGAGNAVLFFDPNDTNAITQANQVIFKDWDPTASTDMQALLDVFDTNHDGKLDAGDASFSQFKLMVTNADGTQSVETLAEAGIASIDLSANNVSQKLSDGSSIDGQTTYTTTSGATGVAATVTFAYDSHGYVVKSTTTADATSGAVTIDNKAFDRNGSLANETISTSSADGLTKTIDYDQNGDGQVDTVQTDNIAVNSTGTVETLTDSTAAGILIDQTITTTSIDTATGVKTVTIERDANGSVVGGINVVSQREVDTTDDGLTSVLIQNLNPDGSVRNQVFTSPTAGGLTSTVQQDINGDGVFELKTVTATAVEAITGSRTTTVTDSNTDGSERDKTITTATADGLSKTVACSSSGNLRLIRRFEKRGSGSSGSEFKRPAVGAASDGLRW